MTRGVVGTGAVQGAQRMHDSGMSALKIFLKEPSTEALEARLREEAEGEGKRHRKRSREGEHKSSGKKRSHARGDIAEFSYS